MLSSHWCVIRRNVNKRKFNMSLPCHIWYEILKGAFILLMKTILVSLLYQVL